MHIRLFLSLGATLAVALIGRRGSTSVSVSGFSEPENSSFGVIFETQNPGIFWCETRVSLCGNVTMLIYKADVKAAF